METRDHENSTLAFLTVATTLSPKDAQRERMKIEFYKTYDVMTGIRIAATLGGFFSMMILLVLYKNYCKPSKTLSEEQLNAAVTAAAEEEDRALQAALEATSFYTSLSKPRQSLGNTSQVLLSPRFSSVGGGYSHLAPPLKAAVLQQRGKSLPGSVLRFGSNGSPSPQNDKSNGLQKEDFDTDDQPPDYFACKTHLNVPPSRRVSLVTCSSADSSYLERRCSAFEMGLPGPPHFVRKSREKLLGKKEEPWDFYYPIDIQVIQPTPEMSPTASERNLHEDQTVCGLQVPGINDQMHRLSVTSFDIGLAPLASISSLGSFSSQSSSLSKSLNNTNTNPVETACSCQEDSVGSDSVFMDDMELDDDDVEFGTDSEFEYDGFDDDYSFCETKQRPVSRQEMRALQFASFDSYDASITQDSISENAEVEASNPGNYEKISNPGICRQCSTDLKRHPSLHEGNKMRKKLFKTYSEPKNSKIKHLPPWTEKGRSGYIPKRQLSSPLVRKRNILEVPCEAPQKSKVVEENLNKALKSPKHEPSQVDENAKDLTKFLLPPSSNSSSSDSVTLIPNNQRLDETITSAPKQGFNKDLPFQSTHQLSLPNTQEKRNRLQKQKNFIEDVKATNQIRDKTEEQRLTGIEDSINFPETSGGLLKPSNKEIISFPIVTGGFLKPPNIPLTGSCERLTNPNINQEFDLEVADVQISLGSCEENSHCQQPQPSFTTSTSQDPILE